jgi:hypothetical protein
MKTKRNRTLYSRFLITAFLLLSVSAALAADTDAMADNANSVAAWKSPSRNG